MYDVFYNFLTSENMLGSAVNYESTLIIARYLSIGLTITTFILMCLIVRSAFRWVSNWLK